MCDGQGGRERAAVYIKHHTISPCVFQRRQVPKEQLHALSTPRDEKMGFTRVKLWDWGFCHGAISWFGWLPDKWCQCGLLRSAERFGGFRSDRRSPRFSKKLFADVLDYPGGWLIPVNGGNRSHNAGRLVRNFKSAQTGSAAIKEKYHGNHDLRHLVLFTRHPEHACNGEGQSDGGSVGRRLVRPRLTRAAPSAYPRDRVNEAHADGALTPCLHQWVQSRAAAWSPK